MKKMKRWAKINAAAWLVFIIVMAEPLSTKITEVWQFALALGIEGAICWLIWESLMFAFGE